MVMEYVSGGELFDYICKNGRVSLPSFFKVLPIFFHPWVGCGTELWVPWFRLDVQSEVCEKYTSHWSSLLIWTFSVLENCNFTVHGTEQVTGLFSNPKLDRSHNHFYDPCLCAERRTLSSRTQSLAYLEMASTLVPCRSAVVGDRMHKMYTYI